MKDSPPLGTPATPKPPYTPIGRNQEKRKKDYVEKGEPFRWLAVRDVALVITIAGFVIYLLVMALVLYLPAQAGLFLAGGLIALPLVLFVGTERGVRAVIKEASDIFFGVYAFEDEHAAYVHLYNYLMNREAPVVFISHGRVAEISLGSPLLKMGLRGPGFVRVDPWSSIVIQSSANLLVRGAGEYFLGKSDTVRGMVDLGLQHSPIVLDNVYTKDNIPLKMNATLYFRIVQDASKLRRQMRRAPSDDAVKLAVMATIDWKEQTKATAQAKVRDSIAQFNFDDIHKSYPRLLGEEEAIRPAAEGIPPPQNGATSDLPRIELQRQLAEMVNEAIHQWGAEVVAITIDEINMHDDVKKTLREAWAAAWRHKVDFERAQVDARIDKRKAEGKRDAAEIDRSAQMI